MIRCILILALTLYLTSSAVFAEHVVELPILAAIKSNNLGVFEVLLLQWDQRPAPMPPALQWRIGNVLLGAAHLQAMTAAFQYAMLRTPSVQHTGVVTATGIAYRPTGSDGPSGGAAMAVGFMALFNGDRIRRGVAMTGTLNADGTVGPVGSLPDKIRAAAREGYRTILIPAGQLSDARWNLVQLGMELNVEIKEVDSVEQAYRLMTGP
jgi:hypothetical protein